MVVALIRSGRASVHATNYRVGDGFVGFTVDQTIIILNRSQMIVVT